MLKRICKICGKEKPANKRYFKLETDGHLYRACLICYNKSRRERYKRNRDCWVKNDKNHHYLFCDCCGLRFGGEIKNTVRSEENKAICTSCYEKLK
jgi:hypothetical protein